MDIGPLDISDSPRCAPPPNVYWRCGWMIAHVVLFASPFVGNHQLRQQETFFIMAFTFPVILGLMQAAFLHRHVRASLLWVPATCIGVAAMVGAIFLTAPHGGPWILLVVPLSVPICQLPLLALNRFRRILLWPITCIVGWDIGVGALFLMERSMMGNPSMIPYFAGFLGLCYGGGSLLGLAFPREEATFRLVLNERRENPP